MRVLLIAMGLWLLLDCAAVALLWSSAAARERAVRRQASRAVQLLEEHLGSARRFS